MELFSAKQSGLMADLTARDVAINNARRDGKDVVNAWAGYFLTLIIDDEGPIERVKKNFYDIIDLQGKTHMVPGFTYQHIDNDQFRTLVEKLMSGKEL